MRRIDGWDKIESFNGFEQMEPGWYPATILEAKEGETSWGDPAVTFYFDILDGKYARYFTRDFKSQTGPDRKWRGTLEQSIGEKGLPYFKGMITAIEESNPGYKFDFDETTLKGKKVGIGFRKEWYEKDGQDRYAVRAFAFRDIAKVLSGELEVPKDKPKKAASGGSLGYTPPNPIPPVSGAYQATPQTAPKYEELGQDEKLPF